MLKSLWSKRSKKLEPKPLPMNLPEFHDWASRIITHAKLPTKNTESQQFALASMILESSPGDFFRPDEYYVYRLKKAASDQVAVQVMEDLKKARAERLERKAKANQGEVTPHTPCGAILEAKPTLLRPLDTKR